jgi:hypothetical protein
MVRVDVPADQAAGMDPDDVPAEARRWRLGCYLLGWAADLREAHSGRSFRDDVVDHEGDIGLGTDVAVLRRGFHVDPEMSMVPSSAL